MPIVRLANLGVAGRRLEQAGMTMSPTDILGYLASAAVLATFCMRTMIPLRTFAIGSNVLFAAYGYLAHIYPVMALHLICFRSMSYGLRKFAAWSLACAIRQAIFPSARCFRS